MGIAVIVLGIVLVLLGGQITKREMREKGYGPDDPVPADGSVVSPSTSAVIMIGYLLVVVGIVLLVV